MRFESARADRVAAVVLFALGIAMLYGGYTMDRLEIRQIHPASIPGLVPMLLGGVLAACAAMLFAGAREDAGEPAAEGVSWSNAGIALGLSLVYALGLVGRVPFFWATAVFIAAFAAVFGWRDAEGRAGWVRLALFSIAFGVAMSGAISALFRYGFLVRLP
jgi:ABC-type Fe3+-siderophore transport system permease subunit